MLLEGGRDGAGRWRDGWTVATGDGSRAAHAEHTVAITADGPMVDHRVDLKPHASDVTEITLYTRPDVLRSHGRQLCGDDVPSVAWKRYVAIGDSSTEGMGDPDGAGGFRGWADRLAETSHLPR